MTSIARTWFFHTGRRSRYRLRVWFLWRKQGRPRDIHVVVSEGTLTADAEGRGLISDWVFDGRYLDPGVIVSVDDLWDRLSARYPVRREPTS